MVINIKLLHIKLPFQNLSLHKLIMSLIQKFLVILSFLTRSPEKQNKTSVKTGLEKRSTLQTGYNVTNPALYFFAPRG